MPGTRFTEVVQAVAQVKARHFASAGQLAETQRLADLVRLARAVRRRQNV